MNRKAIVVGATGLIGQALVEQLLNEQAYTSIKILVRRPTGITHPKLDEKVIDFDQLEQVELDLENADVFCLLGTTIKKAGSQEAFRRVDFDYPLALGRMAVAKGAKQFLIVTSMGANPTSRFFYSRVKGDIEVALRELSLPALHVFRPSLLLGKREHFRFGEKLGSMLWTITSPVLSRIMRKYSPIHAQTVAKAMLIIAQTDNKGIHVYESGQIADTLEH